VLLFTVQHVKNGGPSFLTRFKNFVKLMMKSAFQLWWDFLKDGIVQPTKIGDLSGLLLGPVFYDLKYFVM